MIGIVILNYNNYAVTLKCVDSVFEHRPEDDFHVVVVDNGSKNGAAEVLRNEYQDKSNVTVLALEENLGFAAGNNRGIELCEKLGIDKCVLANSDIVFTAVSIDKLIKDVRSPRVVISGPKINKNGSIQHSSRLRKGRLIDPLEIGRFFPEKMIDEEASSGMHKVFSVSGCCFAIDIVLFREMGAFDENTFLFNEENILGMQAMNAGSEVILDLDALVYHEHGASSGRENDFVRTEYIKSTLYYWRRYRGADHASLVMIVYAFWLKLKLKNDPDLHPDMIRKLALEYLNAIVNMDFVERNR